MRRRRTFGLAAFGAAAALALAACSSGGSSSSSSSSPTSSAGAAAYNAGVTSVVNPSTHKGGTLTFAWRSAPDSFDPGNSYYASVWDFARFYSTALMTFKNCPGACGKTLVPALATAPGTVSDNGLTWTYHIKSGVKFQDGTPVTSQDVKYAVERTFDRGVLANGPNYFQTLLGGNAATYPGPYKDKSKDKMGLTAIDHARQHDGRVPPGEAVLGLRLPGDDPADGPGAAGQGHRRQLPDAHRVHRPVRVPELPAEQDGGPGPEPAVERRAEPERHAAGQQDRRQHEHEPQRRRQPAAGR